MRKIGINMFAARGYTAEEYVKTSKALGFEAVFTGAVSMEKGAELAEIYAKHGVFPEENVLGQKFLVSAVLHVDARQAGQTDALEDSVDYGAVCHLVDRVMRENVFKLIERAAEVVAQSVLDEFPLVQRIQLEIKKPWAPIGLPVAYGSVEVDRER